MFNFLQDYLGSINVIHRDLSCRNILVGANKSLKITDFGLSRAVSEEYPVYSLMTTKHLPFRWMALECLKERDFTVETDVWSFGITLWEIASLGKFCNKDFLSSFDSTGYCISHLVLQ